MSRIPAPVRFLGIVVVLVAIFGACGSLMLSAMDLAQQQETANLFDPGVLFSHTLHFLQQAWGVLTVYTDQTGVPLHDYFIRGVGLTIEFCFISMPLALLLGFVLALMSRARAAWLRAPARGFVEFFRNTPLLVQMLAIYFSLVFLPVWLVNAFTAGVATLVLNYAAYECENIRAGLDAVDIGQDEAAAALGLSQFQTLRFVTIPQMIPIILPPVINDIIYMYKDSSILSLITIAELTSETEALTGHAATRFAWQAYLIAGGVYLLLSLPLARLARWVEARLKAVSFGAQTDLTSATLITLGVMVVIGLF
ncbi:MAG TPA: amino acid ABC transporter permease, partial [Ktedonobacterales bacterium]|nr:amino acid ABC transporter permease [Ktedonobacterales bacterium]